MFSNTMESKNVKLKEKKKAYGLIDSIINKMPEIHIPTYQFCGPGTRLEERLARGDPGKNKLDVACKNHDLAYAAAEDSKGRRKADKILINQSLKRVFSGDAKLDERAAALLVSALMSAKAGLTKIGLGLGGSKKKRKKKKKKKMKRRTKGLTKRKSIAFSKLVRGARQSIKTVKLNGLHDSSLNESIKAAIRRAKHIKRGKIVKIPRVLKLPKFGGNLQAILPILSGLSAIGSITPSAVGVVKAIKDIEIAKKQLKNENFRQHTPEKKIGRTLNLIHKTGINARGTGFYLRPYGQQQR